LTRTGEEIKTTIDQTMSKVTVNLRERYSRKNWIRMMNGNVGRTGQHWLRRMISLAVCKAGPLQTEIPVVGSMGWTGGLKMEVPADGRISRTNCETGTEDR
jgi:hypothetical protein